MKKYYLGLINFKLPFSYNVNYFYIYLSYCDETAKVFVPTAFHFCKYTFHS